MEPIPPPKVRTSHSTKHRSNPRDAGTFDDLKHLSTRSGLAYLARGLNYYHLVRDHIKPEAIMKSSRFLHRRPQLGRAAESSVSQKKGPATSRDAVGEGGGRETGNRLSACSARFYPCPPTERVLEGVYGHGRTRAASPAKPPDDRAMEVFLGEGSRAAPLLYKL